MNLSQQMNQLAEGIDTPVLPPAADIRRAGDRYRSQRRVRFTVGTAVLAVLAVLTTVAILTHPLAGSEVEPAGPLGWRVVRTLEVPGSGEVFYGASSVWVLDNRDQSLGKDGAPAGDLYQLDPTSGVVRDRIPGAVGGWPSVGAGAIWLSTAAGEFNALTRVDLATHRVTRTNTSRPRQLPHGATYAGGNLWVANYASGDLLRMDPLTLRVRQTLHLGDNRDGRAPASLIGDGRRIWVGDDNGLVTRIDGATGRTTSRLQLPIREVRFDGIDARGRLYAHALRDSSLFQIALGQPGPDRISNERALTQDAGGMLAGFAVGSGSVWAATMNPDRLLRIDPETLEIIGHRPLTGMDHRSNIPVALAAQGRTVWVRVKGRVQELSPPP